MFRNSILLLQIRELIEFVCHFHFVENTIVLFDKDAEDEEEHIENSSEIGKQLIYLLESSFCLFVEEITSQVNCNWTT